MNFVDILFYENYDLTNLKSPVNHEILGNLLNETGYDASETQFLVNGFKHGFEIGYQGDRNIQLRAKNLQFTVGTKVDLWNKVMKEVKVGRYAGPFKEIPFKNYIQSPIGLVPKDGGKNTRLIFHLSHPRKTKDGKPKSVNGCTPKWKTAVSYPDFADAVRLCLKMGKDCEMAKSDLSSAFRHFCIRCEDWMLLIMMAESPIDGKKYYFVDKCMPFGASISCSHFQRFSNALSHITKVKTKAENINYLDDFFFVAILRVLCNKQVDIFTKICDLISFPWSAEKTHRATTRITFLGLLIDSKLQKIFIPIEKVLRALNMINTFLGRKSSKVTLKEIQQLCGILNFFSKCVVPARAFTRRLYSLTQGTKVTKANQHLRLKAENKADLMLWEQFLTHPSAFARDFADFSKVWQAEELDFFTDASKNKYFGAGGYCGKSWYIIQWDPCFIEQKDPSIGYLELFGVTVAVLLWIKNFKNKKVAIFCDNMSVVNMINNNSSKCRNCMVLIRIVVLECLIHNVRLCARHVRTKDNAISDSLSRMNINKFLRLTNNKFENLPCRIPEALWPMDKLWLNN